MPARLRPYLLSGVLLTLAVLLSVLLAGEWLYLKHGRETRAAIQPAAQMPLPEDQLLPDDYALLSLSQYQQMAERPLFMESRRPEPPAPWPPPRQPKPEIAPPINFKVMGILATPEGRMTLIADAVENTSRMKVKDALDGWQIAEIKEDTIAIEQAGIQGRSPAAEEAGPRDPPRVPDRLPRQWRPRYREDRGAPPRPTDPRRQPPRPLPPATTWSPPRKRRSQFPPRLRKTWARIQRKGNKHAIMPEPGESRIILAVSSCCVTGLTYPDQTAMPVVKLSTMPFMKRRPTMLTLSLAWLLPGASPWGQRLSNVPHSTESTYRAHSYGARFPPDPE
jgi:hypothetical protein